MATTETAILAALVTAVDAVSGMVKAVVPFSAETIPAHGLGAWFWVLPSGEDSGYPSGSGLAVEVRRYDLVFLWDLTQDGATAMAAAEARARLIRNALHAAEPLAEARITTEHPRIVPDASGRVAEITIPVEAVAVFDFAA